MMKFGTCVSLLMICLLPHAAQGQQAGDLIDAFVESQVPSVLTSFSVSLASDAEGGFYISGEGGLWRYDNNGQFLGISSSFLGTNPTFGPDSLLYYTFGSTIFRFDVKADSVVDEFTPPRPERTNARICFGQEGNLFLSSTGSGEVLRFDGTTGAFIDVFVENGSDGLSLPWQLACGPNGMLYVGDTEKILTYNGADGEFDKVFVSSVGAPFRHMAFGPDSLLYVLTQGPNEVKRFDPDTGALIDIPITLPDDQDVIQMAFGEGTSLFILSPRIASGLTDVSSAEVKEYDTGSGELVRTVITSQSGGLERPSDVLFGPDSTMYVSSNTTGRVLRYNGETGAFIDKWPTDGSDVFNPAGLDFDADGNLYVGSTSSDKVYKLDGTTGAFIEDFVTRRSGGLNSANDLEFGPDGHLYVSSAIEGDVWRYDGTTGEFIDVFIEGTINRFVSYFTFGPDGNLYGASSSYVNLFDGVTGEYMRTLVELSLSSVIQQSQGIEFGPDGDIYITSSIRNTVVRLDGESGELLDIYVAEDDPGGIQGPAGLAFGPDDNLYVADNTGNRILRFAGPFSTNVHVESPPDEHPLHVRIEQYPNPFSDETYISYFLEEPEDVQLSFFNVLGQEVRHAIVGAQSPGRYIYRFDRQSLPAGIYFYVVQTKNTRQKGKMVIIP